MTHWFSEREQDRGRMLITKRLWLSASVFTEWHLVLFPVHPFAKLTAITDEHDNRRGLRGNTATVRGPRNELVHSEENKWGKQNVTDIILITCLLCSQGWIINKLWEREGKKTKKKPVSLFYFSKIVQGVFWLSDFKISSCDEPHY